MKREIADRKTRYRPPQPYRARDWSFATTEPSPENERAQPTAPGPREIDRRP